MGKGDRRHKTKLPTLAPTPRRKKEGRARMAEIRVEQDPQRTALEARCRMLGQAITAEALAEARNPALEGQVGLAIHHLCQGDEAARLWGVFREWDAAEDVYFRRVLGKARHAKTAKIEMMPEALETRPDDRPDLRSDDEKDRDASNRWAKWRGWIGHLAAYDQTALFDGALGRYDVYDGGKATNTGRAFVAALGRLADVVEK